MKVWLMCTYTILERCLFYKLITLKNYIILYLEHCYALGHH